MKGAKKGIRLNKLQMMLTNCRRMSPWKLLTSNQALVCMLSNASIRWTNALNRYNVIGRVEIHHIPQVPGLFRIFVDGSSVIWKESDNTGISKERGPAIKHCIYLPTEGPTWTISTSRVKSSRRPDYKAFAIAVTFPPENADGISYLQVCVEVAGNDTSDGDRFAEALVYANTCLERPVATNNPK
jgi:hypothetical protein